MLHCMSCLSFILFFFPGTHILFSKVENTNHIQEHLLGINNNIKLKTIVSLGNTTKSSKGSYWPASTIKILPAIAVMRSGIKPQTHVRMKRYKGTVRNLLKQALLVSSNKAYDSLVDLVGQDYVNNTAKQLGLKHTWLSRPYGRRGSLAYSPGYYLGNKYIRPKQAKLKHPTCSSNCTSLQDLQKLIFFATRYKELRKWTRRSRNGFAKVVKKHFPSTQVYCKSGYVAYHHGLTNCKFGKYIITIATPCGSWKGWKKNERLQVRLAKFVVLTYLKYKNKP